MIVDLRQLEEVSGVVEGVQEIIFLDAFDKEVRVPCNVELSYNHAGSSYYFHGKVHADISSRCHRCLESVEQPVAGEFDVAVRKSTTLPRGRGETVGDNADYITIAMNEYEVSFKDFIDESFIVGVPMQIVCREDCRGLCPGCGAKLNSEKCTCQEVTDPRWDALRKLSREESEKE
jgi:uncharacterized protein